MSPNEGDRTTVTPKEVGQACTSVPTCLLGSINRARDRASQRRRQRCGNRSRRDRYQRWLGRHNKANSGRPSVGQVPIPGTGAQLVSYVAPIGETGSPRPSVRTKVPSSFNDLAQRKTPRGPPVHCSYEADARFSI